MIASVRGTIEARSLDSVVLCLGPVSVRVQVPAPTLADLGEMGQEVHLFTHLYIREDQWSLYGFSTEEQRRWFELLLGVSGVGPKVALNILSVLPIDALHAALAQGNAELLTRVPGVGKKVAGRLVLELQSKVSAVEAGIAIVPGDSVLVDALTNLGYTASEAQSALRALPADESLSTEDKLLMALRHLADR
ncbi:MAG: Holliday junction branch migration protein RuvA [Bacteroidetes bacterium]|nr:Holliday junction branch migration protein RuvA [Bacteroidota bacterium]